MTNPNVRLDLEALKVLLANCPALPIVAKPQEHDDWGVIRSAERDGDGWQRVFAVARSGRRDSDDELNEHRRAKTDPTQETMDLIVGGLNALPDLIAHIERLQNALKPFATFADTFVDADGWTGPMNVERIVDWFGPSDFREARDHPLPRNKQ